MIFSLDPTTPAKIKQTAQAACGASIILVFTSMSALAFDGTTWGECIDYVFEGCNVEPICTADEAETLFENCDAYPKNVYSRLPSFTAKPPSKSVVNSMKYKQKIRRLQADIRLR